MASSSNQQVTGWVGWIAFAGSMLILAGIFQFIIGLTALFNQNWFVTTQQGLLVFNLATWGWIHLILGIVLGWAGASLFRGGMGGRVIATLVAGLSAISNILFLGEYPIWSLVVITMDILIIYALTVHGGELKDM